MNINCSISNNSVTRKYCSFSKYSILHKYTFFYTMKWKKITQFNLVLLNYSIQLNSLVLFHLKIGLYHVLPFQSRLDMGQWRGTPHSPQLLHNWSITIRLFSFMSRILVWWDLTLYKRCSRCFLLLQLTGHQRTCNGYLLQKVNKLIYRYFPYSDIRAGRETRQILIRVYQV